MAAQGLKVGIVDADIYGHSVPAMLGVADARPDPGRRPDHAGPDRLGRLGDLASGCSSRAATRWSRGAARCSTGRWCRCSPTSTGATSTCCCSTCRPGTGDVAISLGQHLPSAEVVVVTTPQEAAAEVAERAGTMASMMHQRVVGVVENMSLPALPALRRPRARSTGSRSSAPAAATGSRPRCPSASATTSRCSAGSRSTRRCARAATPASRSSSPTRPPPPPRRCSQVAEHAVRPRPRPGRHAARPDPRPAKF